MGREQGDQSFGKVAKTVVKPNNHQNIYIKAQFEIPKHLNKPSFETYKDLQNPYSFKRDCQKLASAKSSPKCHQFFGLLHLIKKQNWHSKVAQFAKYQPNRVTLVEGSKVILKEGMQNYKIKIK